MPYPVAVARSLPPGLGALALGTAAVSALGGAAAACGSAVAPPVTGGAASGGVLAATWQGYLQRFVQADGRVVDPKRGGDSTSEGQSYAMLRAVWMDDRSTFDRVWAWTRDHLATSDHLFGYLWGGGALRSGDSATDADQDVALALLLAAHHWGADAYRSQAATVVRAIWEREVAHVDGTPYVTAGNWAVSTTPGPTLNPSYFAPYAYRLFAGVDSSHPWNDVVDSGYSALNRCTAAPLDTGRSAGLPPNWCVVTRQGVRPARTMQDADLYGYDAFRVMWRLAVDAQWNGEQRARDYLQRCDVLRRAWRDGGRLAAVYSHDGRVAGDYENVAAYGADLGNLVVTDPAAAEQVVARKLLPAIPHGSSPALFGDPDDYYQQNWAWFGLALATGRVPPPG